MIVRMAETGRPDEVPMHRVVAAALKVSEIEKRMGIEEPED